jgi:ClpX C4-type zinc finger
MRRTNRPDAESLCCYFCHKSQDVVGKLFSSPSDYPRAYICDECIAVCASILEDDREKVDAVALPDASEEPHPLLSHPLVSQLLASVVDWMRQESLGNDASEAVARVRSIAARMIADSP